MRILLTVFRLGIVAPCVPPRRRHKVRASQPLSTRIVVTKLAGYLDAFAENQPAAREQASAQIRELRGRRAPQSGGPREAARVDRGLAGAVTTFGTTAADGFCVFWVTRTGRVLHASRLIL